MKKKITIRVKGRVQGVGFRHYTTQQANQYGVTGYVKNMPNGDVVTTAEGEEDCLRAFINALRDGPSFANVRDADIEWSEFENKFDDFRVRY